MTVPAGTRHHRRMSDINYAIDAWIAHLARQHRSQETRRKYQTIMWQFSSHVGRVDVDEITPEHCQRFLDRWVDASASTMALHISILNGFFRFLIGETVLPEGSSPMRNIKRPRRPSPEDLDVVTVGESDVQRMLNACLVWDEYLAVSAGIYLGPRRSAISRLRRRDVDLDRGTMRFREKGGKVIVKPVPHELVAIIREAEDAGVWVGPNDYLIPNRRPPRNQERSSKVIYKLVTDVAARARVRSHVHALRAAFAVHYLETGGTLEGLKELLGHDRIETTMVYLRRLNKQRVMESVRGLSWGSGFPSTPGVPPAGFEPALPPKGIPEPLRRKLAELRAASSARVRDRH